jgi:hypothetical protein
MAIDAAVAAIVVDTRDTCGLWIVALTLLGLSLGVAVRTLLRPGARLTGPLVADMLNARATRADDDLEEGLLEDLAMETLANEQALARKDPMIAVAVALLVLAIVVELAGRL